MGAPFFEPTGQADMCVATDFAVASPANILVPEVPPPAEEEEEQIWSFSGLDGSRSTKDVGVRQGTQRGVREYLASGYTRRNPDGTDWSDDDWAGKWDDLEVTVAEAEASHEFFDVSVAEGSFGDDGDLFAGSGRVLGADSDATATFSLGSEGLDASGVAQINGSVLEGEISSDEDLALVGSADGSVLSGEAEASVEAVLSPEEVTLSGKLGGELNVVEGTIGGDLHITPRRIANPLINLWNWSTNDDVEELSENWDIGIMVGAELSGQVGAQLGAEGEVTYEDGRAVAEAGVKAGFGLGAGVKGRGGIVGLDKVANMISSWWNN
ncbi:hypothetical protein [Yoonia maricola]|nr:hypothetical protein [Yoonia maricola]